MSKKLIAEYIGTLILALGVGLSLSGELPLATPVLAALILAFFVYSVGWLSGSHLNPAVTIGLFSVKKIDKLEAGWYVTMQMLAGLTALFFIQGLDRNIAPIQSMEITGLVFELIGMILFTFGIGMVVEGKIKRSLGGVVIGASLLIGLLFSALGGGEALLNPAVSLALTTTSIAYYAVQIVGGILGFQLAGYLLKEDV